MIDAGQLYKKFEKGYNRKNAFTVTEKEDKMSKALMGKNSAEVKQTEENSSYLDLAFKTIRSTRDNLKENF